MMEEGNGSVPARVPVGDTFSGHVEQIKRRGQELVLGLEELLADEERVHEELSRALGESRYRRDHLKKALEHLTGDSTKYRPQSAGKPAQKAGKKRPGWQVSEDLIQKVLEGYRDHGEPITPTQLAEKIKSSGESASRCTEVLRERELLRLVGRTRGGGSLYVVMPEVAVADAA